MTIKTIGLIGGMSWESSAEYYRHMNQLVKHRLGGLHSAKCLMYSFDFEEVVQLQKAGAWTQATELMTDIARKLEASGCDALLICTNTMHKLADEVEQSVRIPLIHIADTTAKAAMKQSIRKIGLLGTRYTMEQDFLRNRLSRFDIETLIPDEPDRTRMHEIIFDELCKGIIKPSSLADCLTMVERFRERGAEGVMLGCTEITLLLKQEHTDMPLLDTTYLHAEAAVDFALGVADAIVSPDVSAAATRNG